MSGEKIFGELGSRGMALFLDLLAVLAILIGVDVAGLAIVPYANLAILAAYYVGFTASPLQGTPGKRLLGLKVVDAVGARPGLIRSFVRFAVSVASVAVAGIGLMFAAWTKRRQALHDLAARTLVVRAAAPSAEIATAIPAPYGWATRIGFPLGIAFLAFTVHILVTFQRAHVRREAMLEVLTQVNDYRAEVTAALAERRPVPGPARVSGRHARTLQARPDGTIVLEGAGFFAGGRLLYTPRPGPDGKMAWRCSAEGIEERDLFPACRPGAP